MSYLMLLGCCSVWVWRKPGIKEVLVTDRVHRLVITFCPVLVKTSKSVKLRNPFVFGRPFIYIYTMGCLLHMGCPPYNMGCPPIYLDLSGKRARLLNLFGPGISLVFSCFLLFSYHFWTLFYPVFALFLPCFCLFLPCFWVILGSLYLNAIYIP